MKTIFAMLLMCFAGFAFAAQTGNFGDVPIAGNFEEGEDGSPSGEPDMGGEGEEGAEDPEALLERLRQASEEAIGSGDLSISAARRLMQHLEGSLRQTTYLEE